MSENIELIKNMEIDCFPESTHLAVRCQDVYLSVS